MIVALKTAWLFHLEVSPILESSDWWNLELVLENFRTPVTLHAHTHSTRAHALTRALPPRPGPLFGSAICAFARMNAGVYYEASEMTFILTPSRSLCCLFCSIRALLSLLCLPFCPSFLAYGIRSGRRW